MAARKRGRQPGFKMPEEHRSKIKTTQILNALSEHAMGAREMSATQVTAGLGLLKKTMPDLQSVDGNVKQENTHRYIGPEMPTEQAWEQKYTHGGNGHAKPN